MSIFSCHEIFLKIFDKIFVCHIFAILTNTSMKSLCTQFFFFLTRNDYFLIIAISYAVQGNFKEVP